MSIIPHTKPNLPQVRIAEILSGAGVHAPVAFLAIRGYYLDTMGIAGQNDYGVYDDAVFILSPSCCISFNFNTDPSKIKPDIARLKATPNGQTVQYRYGWHGLSWVGRKPVRAFRQSAPCIVERWTGNEWKPDDPGWPFCNIHCGSTLYTSSLGCMTVPPAQWPEFMAVALGEINKYNPDNKPDDVIVPCHLIENTPELNRRGLGVV